MKFKQFIEQQNRVKLKVEGKNLERFIKRLIQHRIALLNIKKINRKTLYITIYEKDYEKIKELKTIYHISIIDTYGVSKVKNNLKKNSILLFSIIIGFLIL